MNLSPKYLIKLLEEHGFIFKIARGSHQIYYRAEGNVTVVVPYHKGRDMKLGTFLAILRQAGIGKNNL
jgi:predicted RNA binding protein YcfA (HicA-like mRNA interferase family)